MEFVRTAIPDVICINPKVFGDHRGYFFESYRKDAFEEFLGYQVNFCQDNESKSTFGVLRGLHFQVPPYAQSKLVRVIEGSVLDVAVDIRKGSPTYGKSVTLELSAANKKQLFIPKGFAHGFVVLSPTAIVAYKCDNYYNPSFDRGVFFRDTSLQIDWQIEDADLILSERDMQLPDLQEVEIPFHYHQNLYEAE